MSKDKSISAEKALEIAENAASKGDKKKAEKYYNAVLKKYPENIQAIEGFKALNPNNLYRSDIDELQDIYYKGDHRQVEVRAKMLLEKYENVHELLNLLAISLAGQEKFDEALEYFEKIVSLNDKSPSAYFNLANIQKATGDLDAALDNYKKAIEIRPNYIDAINNLGNIYRVRGQYEEATGCFIKVLQAYPESREALLNMATTLMAYEKYEEALLHFNVIFATGETPGNIIHDMAMCYRQIGRNEDAYNFFESLVKDIPDYFSAHNNFGNLLHEMGEYEKAIGHFESAISLSPKDPTPYNNLGNLYWECGLFDKSVQLLEKASKILPNAIEIINNHADVLKAKGDYAAARDVYEKSYDIHPKGPVSVTNLAILSFLLGDDDQARHYADLIDDQFIENIKDLQKRKFCSAYKKYLDALLTFNVKAKRNLKDNVDKLWIIGADGSLSSKGHKVKIGGKKLIADCKWIMGTKAYHLSKPGDNQYKSSLKSNLEQIKEASHVLFMFGEIDCQPDEGIIAASQKSGKTSAKIVKKTVGSYFKNSFKMAKSAKVIPAYCAVPAPIVTDDQEGGEEQIKVVEQFNAELKALCDNNDLTYVDVHALTVTKNGRADGSKHLDEHHLIPTAINDALAL